MSERPKMDPGDWVHAAINAVIGVLLGSVIHGLAKLVAGGAWLMALILVLLGGVLFLIVVLHDKLFDWLFRIRIRPARNPKPRPPKPLPRVLSLPVGVTLGVVLAVLGLDGAILALLP